MAKISPPCGLGKTSAAWSFGEISAACDFLQILRTKVNFISHPGRDRGSCVIL